MKRREFFTLLGGGVVAWPRGARSQKPAVPRVGYIWIGARGTDVSNAGLRQGLTDLGYVVGKGKAAHVACLWRYPAAVAGRRQAGRR
jgi:putative ABC transport system substrate-binding protein